MQNELRLTLFQEKNLQNTIKIALVINNGQNEESRSFAYKKDNYGIFMISYENYQRHTHQNIEKMIKFAISRGLDVKLKGDIEKIGKNDTKFLKIENTEVKFAMLNTK